MKRGAVDYISKPFNNDELVLIVRRALGREAAPGREPVPAPGAGGQVHLRQHHRQGQPDAGDLPHDRADRQGLLDGPADGRERHGQGADRPRDPLLLDPQGPQVRLDQLRRPARNAARVGALRPRARGLHRRRAREARPLPGGRQRHALPRRDLRDDAHDAGQAAAGDPGEADPESRRQRRGLGRRAHHRRDQQGPDRPRRRGEVPRGPLLPHQRHPDPPAAPALPHRGHRAADHALHRLALQGAEDPREEDLDRGDAPARGAIPGPATCASSRTRSSAPSPSRPGR